MRPPSILEFERWQQASGGIVGLVTLSPHFKESCAYIAALTAQGIHVAIGHTHASPQQILGAIDAGARLATHLGNGIAPEIPRHRNAIWSLLADDRVSATFIADAHQMCIRDSTCFVMRNSSCNLRKQAPVSTIDMEV